MASTNTPEVEHAQALAPTAAGLSSPGNRAMPGLTINGLVLFVASLLVAASGYTSFRPEIMGLALHPYLVVVAVAFPLVLLTRISLFPVRILVALLLFTAMYFFSVINGLSISLSEIFKLGAAVVTIVTCALLVRSRADFVAASLGLSIAVALLAVNGLKEPVTASGAEVMEARNKNSYSLFALPALLLAGFICLRMPTVPLVIRAILVVGALPSVVVIFMSANRSGYLGCFLVALMLFWGRWGRGLILVGLFAVATAAWLIQSGATEVFDRRMQQTVEGNESDDYRIEILKSCLAIGLENPLIGISPQEINSELGRRTSVLHGSSYVEAHNVFGHIFAASGVICFAALLAIGWTMWTYRPANGQSFVKGSPLYDARSLARMMVLLWAARGMFTREILYNPSFNIALGLCIGLYILAQTTIATEQRGGQLPRTMGT